MPLSYLRQRPLARGVRSREVGDADRESASRLAIHVAKRPGDDGARQELDRQIGNLLAAREHDRRPRLHAARTGGPFRTVGADQERRPVRRDRVAPRREVPEREATGVVGGRQPAHDRVAGFTERHGDAAERPRRRLVGDDDTTDECGADVLGLRGVARLRSCRVRRRDQRASHANPPQHEAARVHGPLHRIAFVTTSWVFFSPSPSVTFTAVFDMSSITLGSCQLASCASGNADTR